MKSDKMIKNSFGSRMRKRLSDITNLNSQHKSPYKNQENALPATANDSSTKDYVNQILQENHMMLKLIEEKDKIIESNRLELQKLRLNLSKTQLQNYQLAQSNSQMMAELNLSKDRLKALQHEFVCKDALFKALILEMKEEKTKSETKTEEAAVDQPPLRENDNKDNVVSKLVNKENEVSQVEDKENEVSKVEDKEGNKVSKVENKASKTKRGRSAKSQSMGPTTSRQAVDKEIMENKRRCLRRQPVRLKCSDTQDDSFEIDFANSPVKQTTDCSRRKSDSDAHLPDSSKSAGSQRFSVGRPQRKATEKVQSYKDPPLNTKMRRPA